jgi:hypothetical protein
MNGHHWGGGRVLATLVSGHSDPALEAWRASRGQRHGGPCRYRLHEVAVQNEKRHRYCSIIAARFLARRPHAAAEAVLSPSRFLANGRNDSLGNTLGAHVVALGIHGFGDFFPRMLARRRPRCGHALCIRMGRAR